MELSGPLHSPAALPPGKEAAVPTVRRVGRLQSLSGRFGEEEKSSLCRESKPVSSNVQAVAKFASYFLSPGITNSMEKSPSSEASRVS